MKSAAALACGGVFGLGLIMGGMTDPRIVLAFLVMDSGWNPALAFVLGGAVTAAFIGMRLRRRMEHPLLAERFQEPRTVQVDAPLVVGSCLFGAGWGLAGFCPGPAIATLCYGGVRSMVFLGAMVTGMGLFRITARRISRATIQPG